LRTDSHILPRVSRQTKNQLKKVIFSFLGVDVLIR